MSAWWLLPLSFRFAISWLFEALTRDHCRTLSWLYYYRGIISCLKLRFLASTTDTDIHWYSTRIIIVCYHHHYWSSMAYNRMIYAHRVPHRDHQTWPTHRLLFAICILRLLLITMLCIATTINGGELCVAFVCLCCAMTIISFHMFGALTHRVLCYVMSLL